MIMTRPQRSYRRGDTVWWEPLRGVYSNQSEQYRQARHHGMVLRMLTDDRALVTFGGGRAITCNTAYMELEE